MKTTILLVLSLLLVNFVSAQYADIAPALAKEKQRKVIIAKMDEVIKRIQIETQCEEEISYTVVDKYPYYKDPEKNLPKTVIFNVCGQRLTYINYLNPIYSSNIGGWNTATWTLDSATK